MRASSTDRIDQLLLVWLMVPRKESRAAGFYNQLKRIADGADDRKRLVNASIARLRERGLIEPGSLLQLTEAGRHSAGEVLGMARLPEGTKLQWAKKVLFLRSMDVAITSVPKSARVADVLAAPVVARRHNVDRKAAADPSKVLAVLARRALGLADKPAALTLDDAFSAVFLMAQSPTPLDVTSTNGHSGPASGTLPLRLDDCDLNEFAHQVTEAARSSTSWHGAVFISQVWKTLQARGAVGITLEKFKRRLIDAHQNDLIELSRADLVDAMPAADVSASETVHSGARFHFVRLDQLAS